MTFFLLRISNSLSQVYWHLFNINLKLIMAFQIIYNIYYYIQNNSKLSQVPINLLYICRVINAWDFTHYSKFTQCNKKIAIFLKFIQFEKLLFIKITYEFIIVTLLSNTSTI